MARVDELLREVIAEELERLDDERLELLTVTGVTTDPDLRHATVWLASLTEDAAAALAQRRVQLQASIGRQVRLKRTPELTFRADPAIAGGARVDEIIRNLPGETGAPQTGGGV